jgi:phosphoribosylaminoimidazole-succinocarboxamide synthase
VDRLSVECVVRGYLFGSVYDEYKTKGTAGGNPLPKGLGLAQVLPEPIFTPTTKAEAGHDENIDHAEFFRTVGKELGERILQHSIAIYNMAREKMEKKGIILADTKFEFGIDGGGELIVVDEVLTPDSSRYWEKETYRIGESPKSYDKQFVRDYLNDIKWNKTPPPPKLPEEIIKKTGEKYRQIYDIIERM